MATIDLRDMPHDFMVLHFGGEPNQINAFTFANTILSLSEAIREINKQLNPDYKIEIVVDALGGGSFRAKIKTESKKIANLFKVGAREFTFALLVLFIEHKIWPDEPTKIIVNDDHYIVERGADRVILPKELYEAREALPNKAAVDHHVAKAFEALDADEFVTEFGVAKHIKDKQLLVEVPRAAFPRMALPSAVLPADEPNRRSVTQKTVLGVIRAVFERGERRWQFVWNGVRISAPIRDAAFFDKLDAREVTFTKGDTLEVELTIAQSLDPASGVYVNDSYEVTRVLRHIRGPVQGGLLPTDKPSEP